jgi:parallel beta-helix repeat protein
MILGKNIVIGLILLLSVAFAMTNVACGTTIYVDGDSISGPWYGTRKHPYKQIQDGIDSANPGDTVYVFNSAYNEHLIVNKGISLIGEGKDGTVIDAGESGSTVRITADCVNISGFTICNSGSRWPYSGVFVDSSNYTTISGNIVTNNNNYGILLFMSSGNTVSDNTVTHNNVVGIYIKASSENNLISGNTVASTTYGIELEDNSSNNMIFDNICTDNDYGIILVDNSSGNTFYHNNLVDNTVNALDSYNNTWDIGFPYGGNYWDDYEGTDEDEDGIGDTPYDIPGGVNQDRYPLVYP